MDLKSFRKNKLKINTQSEFAELLGVDQNVVSMWEENPHNISYNDVQIILEKTGITYDELTGWKEPVSEPLYIEDAWGKEGIDKQNILNYISDAYSKTGISGSDIDGYIRDLKCGIGACMTKPKMVIVGHYDTGKSTLINTLLGMGNMSTASTPAASITVYIKHISDKPAFIDEDVWVFANPLDGDELWNDSQLHDEDYCRSWRIGGGDVEILRSLNTRHDENYSKRAEAAVVFLDAPILKVCDVVDLPGWGIDTPVNDIITFQAIWRADIIVYLSRANDFMRVEDIDYLKRNIAGLSVLEKKGENSLKPLANLFIVASQAHRVNCGNRAQLNEILHAGCGKLLKTLPDKYWSKRSGLSGYDYGDSGARELQSRFFAYSVDIPDLCIPFYKAMKTALEVLPRIVDTRTKAFARFYIESKKASIIDDIKRYETITDERARFSALLAEIDDGELIRAREDDRRRDDILRMIDRLSSESADELIDYLATTVNRDSLVKLMTDKGVKNNKEDIMRFVSSLQSMIQQRIEAILEQKCLELSSKTQEYLAAYANDIARKFEKYEVKMDFNASRAFTSALSSITAIGGLDAFLRNIFSGVYICPFHFSYILRSWNIALLNPLIPIIPIMSTVIVGKVFILVGYWKRIVADEIVRVFDKNKINEKCRDSISAYWTPTKSAFSQAASELDKSWASYVDDMRVAVNNCNPTDIQSKIARLKTIKVFFDKFPL